MNPDPQREAWARFLRAKMDAAGVSVADVAKACGVGKSTVQHWRGGRMPPANAVRPLARALRLSLTALLDGIDGSS